MKARDGNKLGFRHQRDGFSKSFGLVPTVFVLAVVVLLLWQPITAAPADGESVRAVKTGAVASQAITMTAVGTPATQPPLAVQRPKNDAAQKVTDDASRAGAAGGCVDGQDCVTDADCAPGICDPVTLTCICKCSPAGDEDCFTTACDGTTFADVSIPADYFGPGSPPFAGSVDLGGPGGFPGDTIIKRQAPVCFTGGFPETVGPIPVEVIQLDLRSCSPIDVGGILYDVIVSLAPGPQPGDMTITKEDAGGGTFKSNLTVTAQAVFQFAGSGGPDLGPPIVLPPVFLSTTQPDPSWLQDEPPGVFCGTTGFFPGWDIDPDTQEPCCEPVCHANPNGNHPHCVTNPKCPPCPPPDPKACEGKGTPCGDPTQDCICETRPDGTLNCADANDYFSGIHGFCPSFSDTECEDQSPGTKCFLNIDPPVCAHNCGKHVEPDPHITVFGTSATFGAPDVPPIPADFFFPGSQPFVGTVNLTGGPNDTLGQRDGPIECPGAVLPRPCDPVGVELIELSLVSTAPITVGPTQWDVEVDLSPTGAPPLGTLTATLTHTNGGTYNAGIPFSPRFTFTEVGNPGNVRVLDYDIEVIAPIEINFVGTDWVVVVNPALLLITPNNGNFVPGVRENTPGDPNSQKVVQALGLSKDGGIDHPIVQPPDPKACQGKGLPCGDPDDDCICETRPDGTTQCAEAADIVPPCQHGTCQVDLDCEEPGTKCYAQPGALGCCAHNCGDHVCPEPCTAAADCDDGDPCTRDECDDTGCCTHDLLCTTDADCNDGNLCTTDTCDAATGCCDNEPDCTTNADCNDNDPCTTDTCDAATGCCDNRPDCTTNADCNDNDPCTTDTCDAATGCCDNRPDCTTPADCNDNNACTMDFCSLSGCCGNTPDCTGCEACVDGACVDNQANCPLAPPLGCQACVNAVCVDSQAKCPVCEDCLDGACEPIPECKDCEGKGSPCGDATQDCVCETRFDGTLNCADARDFFDPTRHGACPNGDDECPTGTKCFVNTPDGVPVCAHNCGKHVEPDPHVTQQGTSATFGAPDVPQIPADFFGPGSDPFTGTVNLLGGPNDTLGQRDGPIECPGAGFPRPCDPVGVELIQLSLVSADPIIVTENGGQNPTAWDVEVDLSPSGAPPLGTLTATITHLNGGTYNANIPFSPRFTFTEVGNPANVRVLDYGAEDIAPIILNFLGVHWVVVVNPALAIIAPNSGNFVPGVRENIPGDQDSQKLIQALGLSKGEGIDHPVQQPPDPKVCQGKGSPCSARGLNCICETRPDGSLNCADTTDFATGRHGFCPSLSDAECEAQSPGTKCFVNEPFPVCAHNCGEHSETEACCFDDGSCLNLTPDDCRGQDGAPRGPGTACQGDADGNGIDDACEFDTKCEHCGPGPHWIDFCPAGHDRLPSGAVLGIDTTGNCQVDLNLVMFGPAEVARGAGSPHSIPTEMVSMKLSGGGAVLRAGAGGGVGPGAPLGASVGSIVELGDTVTGDSSFGMLFELDLGGGLFAYNQTPLSLTASILCVSPNRIYAHPDVCIPLFDLPGPDGVFVANLVTANHDPFADPLCPLPPDDPLCLKRQIFDCVGTDQQTCLPRVLTNTDGMVEAVECDCFEDTGECGPVSISADGTSFSCSGSCPDPQKCVIHLGGTSTGATTIPISDVPDGDAVTCDCTCNKSAPPGKDGWATACDGSTSYDFSLTPIPADFFGPGSEPFTDVVDLGGLTGGIDTEIFRKDEMCFSGPLPVTAVTGIRLQKLDLVSCEKILVDIVGQQPEEWQLIVRLAGPQDQGTLTAIKLDDDGGTYTAVIPVNAEFLFVRNSDGETRGPIPAGNITLSTTVPAPWDQTNCAVGFCPGFTTDPGGGVCCKPTCHDNRPASGHKHCTQPPDCPPCPECTYDNGPPLDDFVIPASQFDAGTPFSAETADDFFFTGKGSNPCNIEGARFWTSHFNMPAGVVPDPATQWTGVTVSIYDNADPKGPAGNRNDDGSFTAGLVATRTVPMTSVVVTPFALACINANSGPTFQIDVTFTDPIQLEKNHKYWIVFQPNMVFGNFGQTAVLLSEETHDHPAQQIFNVVGTTNWTVIDGNDGSNGVCNNLPPGSRRDIAFELFAVKDGICLKPAPSGIDCWTTLCDGSSSYDFNLTPIPADFFAPGSDPFAEVVDLGGPTGFADTQVLRKDEMCFDEQNVTQSTPIELVKMNLVSCLPITVTFNGGQNPEQWNVIVQLAGPQPQGTLQAIKTHDNGGTYTADLPVNAQFLFERVSDGFSVGPIPAAPTVLSSSATPWQQDCVGLCGGVGFCPGVEKDPNGVPCCTPTCHEGPAPGHLHCTVPPDCPACPRVEPPIRAPDPDDILKNRYISIDPTGASGNNPASHHIRVRLDSTQIIGLTTSGPWWAGPHDAACISVVTTTKPGMEPNWSFCPVLHLTGCPIVPTSTYALAAESGGNLSAEALFDTQAKPGVKWHGDCVGFFNGTKWTAPNGETSIDDAVAAIKTFQNPGNLPGCGTPPCNATHTSVTDVVPSLTPGPQINKIVNIADVFSMIKGFQGFVYPGDDLTECP